MRSLFSCFILLVSLGANAHPNEELFSQLKSTSWKGSFHFEVYRKGLTGVKKAYTSAEYQIGLRIEDQMSESGQIPYVFEKDVSQAKGFDAFVFKKIDVQACPGEARLIEVSGETEGAFSGVVHAPECKGEKRTIKQLPVQSLQVQGDQLNIVIADKAIGEAVTFRIIYKLQKAL